MAALLVGLGSVLVVAAMTCAQGTGREDLGDGGSGDGTVTADVQGVDDGGLADASANEDGSVQPDSTVQNDAGPACDPDPLPETAGAQCGSAIDLGVLGDVSADMVMVTGNSMPAGREIWWSFLAADDVDTAGDEFHVDVRFINNPGSGYQMDVFRGGCAPEDQLADSETFTFDWYTDFPTTSTGCTGTTPCGEGDCVPSPGAAGINSCDDDTAVFYVRVRRIDGAASCDVFNLGLSNGLYIAP